jgi:tol-pal system protein YbgF
MRPAIGFLLLSAALWPLCLPAATGSVEMRLRALESRLPDADRLAALEKSLNSQGAGVLAGELEQLKAEVRELRGLIEQLTHQLQKQQAGQHQLYNDLDRRLQALEAKATMVPSVSSPVPEAGGTTPPGAPPAAAGQEQAEYLASFELLQQGKTAEAFLERYPNGGYAANARYWLGEAHYVSKNYPQALAEFQKLLEQHPDSSKLSGALLKIGYIHYETRNFTEARAVLERVKAGYPNTQVGTLAAERLERMRKEGG